MPGRVLRRRDAMSPTLERYLACPAVQAALPPGKVLRWGSDTRVARRNSRIAPIYVLDSRPIITGEYLDRRQAEPDPIEGTLVEFTLNNEGGRRFRTETAKHIQRLHGDRARRAGHGPAAGHPERDRHARPDHDGRRDPAGCAGSRARAARGLAARAAQDRRGAATSERASVRTRSPRESRAGIIAIVLVVVIMIVLLPLLRRARGGRARRSTCCTRWPCWPASTPCSRCPGSPDSCSPSVSRSTRTC